MANQLMSVPPGYDLGPQQIQQADLETRINLKMQQLATGLANLQFPRNSLSAWIRNVFTENQLFWFATAMPRFTMRVFDDSRSWT